MDTDSDVDGSRAKLHPSFEGVGRRRLTEEELVDVYQKAYNDANDPIKKDAAGARLTQLKRIFARRPKPF
jgi:hypothetical protein